MTLGRLLCAGLCIRAAWSHYQGTCENDEAAGEIQGEDGVVAAREPHRFIGRDFDINMYMNYTTYDIIPHICTFFFYMMYLYVSNCCP